jgi:hypothetical protein
VVAIARKFSGKSLVDARGLGLSTNEVRPVRFHARVIESVFPLRLALQTLGELVWSDSSWMDEDSYSAYLETVLDPVITVHPDRVFFEAFSQEQSAYGMVIADRSIFETAGEVAHGTTNVDFTTTLHAALSTMRSSRETWFRVGPQGFGVETTESELFHFEDKVELPESWVRGFLQLQGAMAMPGTRFEVRPVDLKTLSRYIREHKAERSPRSIRWEFEPGEDVRAVIEPWNEVVSMKGARHNYREAKTTRIWGRKRLALIEPLLGRATGVEVYLKGRALPSFYAVKLPGVTFLLGLSGWSTQGWTRAASFDLLTAEGADPALVDRGLAHLREAVHVDEEQLAAALDCEVPAAARVLTELCRRGRAVYDVRARDFRHRELFAEPIDPARFYPPDPRKEASAALVAAGKVRIASDEIREKHVGAGAGASVFRNRAVAGSVAGHQTQIVIQDTGRIIFGRCDCKFFDENLMNQGPCEHMLALREVAQ